MAGENGLIAPPVDADSVLVDPDGRATRREPGLAPGAASGDTSNNADGGPEGNADDGWPIALDGVTETVVATLGPNDRYNQAALGLHAGSPATARTWGRTRTRRNFDTHGTGYVQWVPAPTHFVEAALGVLETEEPLLSTAAAWVRVDVEQIDAGTDAGTEWREWRLDPVESAVRRHAVPTLDRGRAAVIEATVAASRLDVEGYDESMLLDRLAYFDSVVESCGGAADRRAFDRLSTLVPWRRRR